MKYLIVLILCTLAVIKVSLQSGFGKSSIKNMADTLLFNALIFAFAGILFSAKIIGCSYEVWLYAATFGVFTALFQVTYTKALSTGNVSLSVLVVNLSMIFPISVSYFMFDEPLSSLRLMGIILTILALFAAVDFKAQKNTKTWFKYGFIAFLANGTISVIQKFFSESQLKNESQAFVSCSYIVAAIVAFIVFCIISKKVEPKTFKLGKKAIFTVIAIGVVLASFQVINTYAISVIDGTFLFPAYYGGCIVLSTITGCLLFKDKLTAGQKLSLLIGTVAVIIMSF